MATIVYPAFVDEAQAATLSARFPEFPELSIVAATPGELMAAARDKLGQRLRQLEKAGEEWPEPSTLAGLRATAAPNVTTIWVDVSVDDTPIRVTISLGERLLARIDTAAEARSLTRSGYLASAARRQLDHEGASSPSQAILEEVVAAGRKVQETLGPSSPIGRTLADLDALALDGLRKIASGVSDAMTKSPSSRAKSRSDRATHSETTEERHGDARSDL